MFGEGNEGLPKRRKEGRVRGLTIAISGVHGSGKSTIAKALASKLNLRLVSAGSIFRNIAKEKGVSLMTLSELAKRDRSIDAFVDRKMREEAMLGSVVLEGHLAGWMTKDFADLKIFFKASDDVRLQRITEREGDIQVARELLRVEQEERERWKKFYGIDPHDLSTYDLILNTDLISPSHIVDLIVSIVRTKNKPHNPYL
jgi:cytidylate kinase